MYKIGTPSFAVCIFHFWRFFGKREHNLINILFIMVGETFVIIIISHWMNRTELWHDTDPFGTGFECVNQLVNKCQRI